GGDDDGAEDGPAEAADELTGAAEGGEDVALLDHDRGGDDGPDRQQDAAGDDQQEEADADADAVEEAGADQRPEDRADRAEEVADRGVAAPVLHVVDEADDHPLIKDRDGKGDHGDDQQQTDLVLADDAAEDRDHEEEPEGGRDQDPEVLFVEVEDPVQDLPD